MPSDAEATEHEVDSSAGASESEPAASAGATGRRVPTWVWVVLGILGAAVVAVTLALFLEARDASENAKAGAESAAQLLDDLVANVQTTNDELEEFNDQFAAAASSGQAKASEAQKRQSERSSSNDQSP